MNVVVVGNYSLEHREAIDAAACPPGDPARYEAAYEQLLARPRISYRVTACGCHRRPWPRDSESA